jgi:hypothetical protein
VVAVLVVVVYLYYIIVVIVFIIIIIIIYESKRIRIISLTSKQEWHFNQGDVLLQ